MVPEETLAQCEENILAAFERKRKNNNKAEFLPPLLVAISGVPGSGKTTLARALVERLNTRRGDLQAANLPMDGYHFFRSELAQMPNPEEAFARRGAEWTFDVLQMIRDLRKLLETGELDGPSFDHATKDPVRASIPIRRCHQIVVAEGNYLTYVGTPEWAELVSLFDVKIFVEIDDLAISTERLTLRHMEAWGITREEAFSRAGGSDFVNAQLVAKTKGNADFCVPGA